MRVYLCFLGPLDQDKPWAPQGIRSQHDFLKRFWRLYFDGPDDTVKVTDAEPTEAEKKVLHKTIKKVSEDIEKLALNTAISALHIATKEFTSAKTVARSILEPLCQLIHPFAPHVAEQIWKQALGHADGISYAAWPQYDEALATDDTIRMGVQIMGKTRGEVEIAKDADEATAVAAAKAVDAVARHLEGKTIVRVIYKPGRILNLIAK